MTRKLRPRRTDESGAAADCIVPPNRHRAAALASVADSTERLYSGAVAAGRHSSATLLVRSPQTTRLPISPIPHATFRFGA